MVSHPEAVDPSMAHRAPGSVASSRPSNSHSRRVHRHGGGRSHHGGSSHHTLNEFPIFSGTGDVEVVIQASNQERRYLLHRLILAQNSGFFDAGTSEEWSRVQAQREVEDAANGADSSLVRTNSSDIGLAIIREDDGNESLVGSSRSGRSRSGSTLTKMRWRYELDWENREDNEVPILVQKVSRQTSDFIIVLFRLTPMISHRLLAIRYSDKGSPTNHHPLHEINPRRRSMDSSDRWQI